MPIDPNVANLLRVARMLEELTEEFVFTGGAIVGLLVTDPAAPQARPTKDVDCVVETMSRAEYDTRIRTALHKKGFVELVAEGVPVCAWTIEGIRLDVLPTAEEVLGFSNEWYLGGVENAEWVEFEGVRFQVFSTPYFMASKIEAFRDRGKSDLRASHDLEDVVAVIDGRESVVDDVLKAPAPARAYIQEQLADLLQERRFIDALPGHVLESGRAEIVRERMERISQSK